MFGIELLGLAPLAVILCATLIILALILAVDAQLGDRRKKDHEARMEKLKRRTKLDDRELKLAQEETKQARERTKTERARENRVAQQLKREKMNARIEENRLEHERKRELKRELEREQDTAAESGDAQTEMRIEFNEDGVPCACPQCGPGASWEAIGEPTRSPVVFDCTACNFRVLSTGSEKHTTPNDRLETERKKQAKYEANKEVAK